TRHSRRRRSRPPAPRHDGRHRCGSNRPPTPHTRRRRKRPHKTRSSCIEAKGGPEYGFQQPSPPILPVKSHKPQRSPRKENASTHLITHAHATHVAGTSRGGQFGRDYV